MPSRGTLPGLALNPSSAGAMVAFLPRAGHFLQQSSHFKEVFWSPWWEPSCSPCPQSCAELSCTLDGHPLRTLHTSHGLQARSGSSAGNAFDVICADSCPLAGRTLLGGRRGLVTARSGFDARRTPNLPQVWCLLCYRGL